MPTAITSGPWRAARGKVHRLGRGAGSARPSWRATQSASARAANSSHAGEPRGREDALLLHVLQRLEYATAEDRPGVTGQLRADAAREREDCGALESRAQVLEELRNDRSVLLGVMPHDRGELLE